MISNTDYNKIMIDHSIFNSVVYTPLSNALKILEQRKNNETLTKKVSTLFSGDIPEILKTGDNAVMARQLATPNHESRLFIKIAQENNLRPIFFEYYEDKFTSNNNYKHSLGQININHGLDKNGKDIFEKINIIDFNLYNGEKIIDVKTKWGESLINFHKNLFNQYNIENIHFHDESKWYNTIDGSVESVYYNFFLLFTCYGILFENFLVSNDSEGHFTKNVVLPALNRVIKDTGVKPLIVPIPPMDIELEDFWYSHLSLVKDNIK